MTRSKLSRPYAAISALLQRFRNTTLIPATIPHQLVPLARTATLRRSVGLLSDFRYEQSDPDKFYGHLAEDTVALISKIVEGAQSARISKTAEGAQDVRVTPCPRNHLSTQAPQNRQNTPNTQLAAPTSPLAEHLILDVGGGPGYFGRAFAREGATYISCEPDVGEMAAAGIRLASSVRGSGLDLPFRSNTFTVTYSSNVAEHVPDPWRMACEMIRVTRPGGLIIFSYTIWLGPFGGHETGLWQHYISGEYAARRYRRIHGKEPKNRWGTSLFDVSCSSGLHFASAAAEADDIEMIGAFPRYHPWWAWWCAAIPGFREFAVSNLVLVMRKK